MNSVNSFFSGFFQVSFFQVYLSEPSMVWPSLYEPACFVRQVAKLSEIVAHVMLWLHMCEDLTPESWSGCPWGTLDIDFGLHRAWSFWYYAFHVKYLKLIAKHLFICQEYVKCVFLYPDKSVMVISVLVKAVTWDTSLTVLQWNKKDSIPGLGLTFLISYRCMPDSTWL